MDFRISLITRIIFGLLTIFFFWSCKQQEKQKPNIVILYTDDQGTLDAGCYGATDLYTPNIDQLSNSGVRFTKAYAHTVCCSSRAALLTGRHPQRSGINNWTQNNYRDMEKGINMPLDEVTLAEVLKENGYRTGLFGIWERRLDMVPSSRALIRFMVILVALLIIMSIIFFMEWAFMISGTKRKRFLREGITTLL